MENVEKTIVSQYGTTTTISQLIKGIDQNIDPRTDLLNFYNYVWNVETAQGFGLDTWGKIVGVSRNVVLKGNQKPFGFSQSTGCYPFNEGTFYTADQTYGVELTDAAYRTLIYTKALANISATTAMSINNLLKNLFSGRGEAYALDIGNMELRYVFLFHLTPVESAIIKEMNVLPRPAGVRVSYLEIYGDIFGFSQASPQSMPFNQGVFLPSGSLTYAA
jgi:hypothetical protein